MSSSLPSAPGAPTTPAKSNRGFLITVVVALVFVCLCVVVAVALGGGLFISGKLGPLAQGSTTPVAALIVTATPPPVSTAPNSPTPSNSPTSPNSPTVPNSPTASNTLTPLSTPTAENSPTAAPTATPAVAAATPPTWASWPVVFSENFSSNKSNWNVANTQPSTSDYGTIGETIGGGKLHLEANMVKGASIKYWPKSLQPVSDFAVSVDGLRVSGAGTDYGLVFRRDANGNCYVFLIRDADKQFAVYVFQAQWTNLIDWTNSDAILSGQVNHLTVSAEGAHFTFFINNRQVGSLNSSQLGSGLPGVTFDTAANTQAVFEFSNFTLQAPAVNVQATPSGQTTLATPPSVEWPVVMSDNFSSNTNGWNISDQQPYTSDYGTFDERLGGGTFTIDAKTVKGVNEKYWPKNLKTLSDLSVTVDARRTSGPTDSAYGVVFRRDANNNFYVFEIRDTKQYSVWLFQGQWTNLVDWTNADGIQAGQVNHLNVTASGAHITFSINGQQVGSIDNSQVGSGVAGVALDLDANLEAAFEFSNFEVRGPSAAGLATPAPPSQWRVVLSDNFALNSNGWNIADKQPNTDDYGTYSETIGGGKLTIDAQVTKGTNQKRWPKIPAVADFSVSVDARQVSGPTDAVYGLMFRRDTNGNVYIFEVRDDKQFSVWVFQSQWSNLIPLTKSDAIQPGQVNHLIVTGLGSHLTFSVNSQQVATVDNSQLTSGLVGVMFEMNPGEAVFEFSNFELDTP